MKSSLWVCSFARSSEAYVKTTFAGAMISFSEKRIDLQQRITPPLPTRAPSTDFLKLKLQKLLDESEATSPTVPYLPSIIYRELCFNHMIVSRCMF